uniref:Uncharacterized protein n=1 Tax=Pseudictyota dubia TaxID=2749911 RepID=A0A7R9W4G8_9STRA|mmetsp:Transcript_31230/g.57685  ORF Transcript_31230/g.57685 Transcript_31230/m.57685 type:complete len:318 (+) Transcript_31230:64-1017(+)
MTQGVATTAPGSGDVEVEEVVKTRANPDGTLTTITEIRKADGSMTVVEETIQRDGEKTVVMKEFMLNDEPSPNFPPANYSEQPAPAQYPVEHTSYPPSTGRDGFSDEYQQPRPGPKPQMTRVHPKDEVFPDEEMCCGDFPHFGVSAECRPINHTLAKEGPIEWAWCPTFSWLKVILITSGLITAMGLLMMVLSFGKTGVLVAGIIFFIGGIAMTFIFGIWKWNADKQAAYKVARGKRLEAMALWKQVDPQFHYLSKDRFYEARYGGKVLRVLRDGTIEVEGTHRDAGGGEDPMGDAMKASSNASEMVSNVQGAIGGG